MGQFIDKEYRSCHYQVEKPTMKVTTDYRGTLLKEGSKVAYNYSGNVAIGTVVGIVKDEWYSPNRTGSFLRPENVPKIGDKIWWYHRFMVEIKHESGHISKVKNYQSFLVIE